MGGRREPWRWLLLALPFAIVAAVPRAALDELALAAARPLAGAAAELEAALPKPTPPPAPLPPAPEAAEIASLDGAPGDAAPPGDVPSEADAEEPGALRGVMVSRARVLAAAEAGMRPTGASVASTSWRPAGLALIGVNPIGVGLRDGDVVTRVGGTPATSQGAVIGAVTSALRQKLPAITGEVWRGRRKILVTVELPEVRFDDEGPAPVATK